ncbi:MAG: hypothetical protein KDD33_00760 [Bdellovibrionales bacterium]|nr:hypothetical protein [Bdellovibrionales bacterium]
MKSLMILLMFFLNQVAWADASNEFLFEGRSMSIKENAEDYFNAQKRSNETDEEIDVCYVGDWELAVDSVHPVIFINVLDIYGGGELDTETEHENGDSTYGIIPEC